MGNWGMVANKEEENSKGDGIETEADYQNEEILLKSSPSYVILITMKIKYFELKNLLFRGNRVNRLSENFVYPNNVCHN